MIPVLSRRALNRATLARQFLLDRVTLAPIEAIEHLAGMQSQAPLAPYIGLWTRLRDFEPDSLSELTEQRSVVRTQLMRNTVHLVSAEDCLNWHGLFHTMQAAAVGSHFRDLGGVDRPALAEQARALLEEEPRTRAALGRLLGRHWTDADPAALAHTATQQIPVCQVPPRGVWGKGGAAAWTPVESWLGTPLRPGSADALVLRYLGAFGPATVADVQLWSGLTRLREVVERLPLRTFRGPDGEALYDLPDATRPAEDVPAPPRFLPAYDNLLLSHRDRTRVIADNRAVPLPPGNGTTTGTFLLDGMWSGIWHSDRQTIRLHPFAQVRRADREALLEEAGRLHEFIHPQGSHDIAVVDPR